MGVSFEDRNPKDGSLPYRPHLQYSGLREQACPPSQACSLRRGGRAQGRSIVDATLRCGAAAIIIYTLVPPHNHRANGCRLEKRPPYLRQRMPFIPALKSGAFWHVLVKIRMPRLIQSLWSTWGRVSKPCSHALPYNGE
jgi:hypothetical protein